MGRIRRRSLPTQPGAALREEGFYWVFFGRNSEAQPAQWKDGRWWMLGDPRGWTENWITVVGERLVAPKRETC